MVPLKSRLQLERYPVAPKASNLVCSVLRRIWACCREQRYLPGKEISF